MASITKDGNSYRVRVRIQSVTKCKSFQTKAQAKAWAAQIETEIRTGAETNKTKNSLADAIKRYGDEISINKRGERWEIIRLNSWASLPFIDYKMHDITTRHISEWRDLRLKSVKTSTVNRELNLLSSVFEVARREWQWISSNPVRDIVRPKQPPHRERIYSEGDRDLICAWLGFDGVTVSTKQHIVAIAFLFALETAMRREEITGLEWDRIDKARRVLTLPMTKNGDSREVPLSTRAVELLGLVSGFDRPFQVDKDSLSTLFRRAVINSGIEPGTFHDSRGTAITRLSKILNVLDLARMIGHRDIKSLQVYYREKAEDIALKLG